MKIDTEYEIPTLEHLAETYCRKNRRTTILGLARYLRCDLGKAADMIKQMEAGGILEKVVGSTAYKWHNRNKK